MVSIKKIKLGTTTYDVNLPNAITFSGATTSTFDGSKAITIDIPAAYTLPITSTTSIGGAKIGKKYTSAVTGFTVGSGTTAPAIQPLSTTIGKYYAVESDSSGLLFVNVPWVNTDTNTKVDVTLNTATKAYLLATSSIPTNIATGVTALADTGVYLDTTAGTLHATLFSGSGSSLTNLNASNISLGIVPAARLPVASSSAIGIVNTSAQSFSGRKTLTADLQSSSTAFTQAVEDNSTKIATTAFVKSQLTNLSIDEGTVD